MGRRGGAKHILQAKPTKHHIGEQFVKLISKNGTPRWREAHLQVKMLKSCGVGTTFWSSDVEKLVSE